MTKKLKCFRNKLVFSLLLSLLLLPIFTFSVPLVRADSNPWSDWSYCRKLTFNNSAQSENLVDFTVLVKLNSSNFNFSKAQSDGDDIRFVDSDNFTLLKHHWEYYDSIMEKAYGWFKVPQIDAFSSTDHVFMRYGNENALNVEDEENTYDSSFVGVWHLDESSGTVVPNSLAGPDGVAVNIEDVDWVSGKIGNCLELDGINEFVNLGDIASFERDESFSIGVWASTTSSGIRFLMTRMFNFAPYRGWQILLRAGKMEFFLVNDYMSNFAGVVGSTMVNDGIFHQIDITYDGSSNASGIKIYVDGSLETMTISTDGYGGDTLTGTIITSANCLLGTREGAAHWPGRVDEALVSKVERSVDWVGASYLSMTSKFITYGDEVFNSNNPGNPHVYVEPGESIQAAITTASEHDVIIVAAGTYDEFVAINKPLTLFGESGAVIRPSVEHRPGYAIVEVFSGVTVEGFEVDGSSLNVVWAGIGSWSGCTNVTIRANTIHGMRNAIDKGNGICLWRWGGIYEGILIEENTIYDIDRMGIYIGSHTVGGEYDWLLSTNNTIRDNLVYDTMLSPNPGEIFPIGCGGIGLDAMKDCTIERNTVYNTANMMPAIFLAHGSSTGNEICENEVYGQAYGVAVEINRGDVDFGVDVPAPPEVHSNSIHDNTEYGLIVLNAAGKTVDATFNWWGTILEGEIVGMVSSSVDFDPWIEPELHGSITGHMAETVPVNSGTYHIDAMVVADTDVYVDTTTSAPIVVICEYEGNPGAALDGDLGMYIDVYLSDVSGVERVQVHMHNGDLSGGEVMYYLSGTEWLECLNTGANGDYVWAIIDGSSTPPLSYLSGGPFGNGNPNGNPAGGAAADSMEEAAEVVATLMTIFVIVWGLSGKGKLSDIWAYLILIAVILLVAGVVRGIG